jgi:hypothetical protein
MTFGEDARLLDTLELFAACRQDCGQVLDFGFYFRIIFNSRGEAMPASVAP